MKTKFFTLLFAIMAGTTLSYAAIVNGTCGDNLTWSLNTKDSTITIEGSGKMNNWNYYASVPWSQYRSYISNVFIDNGITTIGEHAFYDCPNLKNINIPNSITRIGELAFGACVNLCGIELPPSIDSIRNSTFEYCSKLFSINIPLNVTYIGDHAFQFCSSLSSIELPNGVEYIGEEAFRDCNSLSSFVIPESTTRIGIGAFYNCTGLISLVIPKNITSIGERAFQGCNNMTSMYWNAIKCEDFSYENNPFRSYYDSSRPPIQFMYFGEEVEYIPAYLCNSMSLITTVELPNSLQTIGQNAFSGCSNLYTITIPDNVTSIGERMCNGCSNMKFAKIGNGLTRVAYQAFCNCSKLDSVVIGSNISHIEEMAFYNCPITFLSVRAIEPPAGGGDNCGIYAGNCTLYVPYEAVETYANTIWWEDFKEIKPICIVTFQDWNDDVIARDTVLAETSATSPADPTRAGYTFTGWDKDFSNVTEDMTVTAQYSINNYQVDFLDWDGTLLKSDKVEYGSAATPPANPSREWYTFVGWDKDFSSVTSDLVVTAQYEEGQTRDNTIFFINGTDDSEISNQVIEIDFPTPPTVAGFTFLKWQVLASDIDYGIQIQAVYSYNGEPTSAPSVVTNPSNPAQKLIRNGSVYILTDDTRTYTLTGQQVR